MAGKAKSVYLSVCNLSDHKAVLRKTFFNASEYRAFVTTPEFLAQYPAEFYYVVKETY